MGKIGIYGGGTIGSGFAAYYALKGRTVRVYEERDAGVDYARQNVMHVLDTYEKLGLKIRRQEIEARIIVSSDAGAVFSEACFIQENGRENVEEKRKIIAEIEQYAPPDTIIASSSSGITATLIAEGAKCPERILVAHPFNPSYLLPLIEISGGKCTTPDIVQRAVDFYQSVDKVPIVLKREKVGFVANRLSHALWREEIALVHEGVCTLEDADNAVLYGPGLRWGAVGPAMNYELGGGQDGLMGAMEKFGETSNAIFRDLSNLSETPAGFVEMVGQQMPSLVENLPGYMGTEKEDTADFRDRTIVALLKIHHKL